MVSTCDHFVLSSQSKSIISFVLLTIKSKIYLKIQTKITFKNNSITINHFIKHCLLRDIIIIIIPWQGGIIGLLHSWACDQFSPHICVESQRDTIQGYHILRMQTWWVPSLSRTNQSQCPPPWRLTVVTDTWLLIALRESSMLAIDSSLVRSLPNDAVSSPHWLLWRPVCPIVIDTHWLSNKVHPSFNRFCS